MKFSITYFIKTVISLKKSAAKNSHEYVQYRVIIVGCEKDNFKWFFRCVSLMLHLDKLSKQILISWRKKLVICPTKWKYTLQNNIKIYIGTSFQCFQRPKITNRSNTWATEEWHKTAVNAIIKIFLKAQKLNKAIKRQWQKCHRYIHTSCCL